MFLCKKCGATQELQKSTMVIIDEKVVTKEAKCSCKEDQYMDEVLTKEHEGFPTIRRNDSAQKL